MMTPQLGYLILLFTSMVSLTVVGIAFELDEMEFIVWGTAFLIGLHVLISF